MDRTIRPLVIIGAFATSLLIGKIKELRWTGPSARW
jgi:hypothetical protein